MGGVNKSGVRSPEPVALCQYTGAGRGVRLTGSFFLLFTF